LRQLKALAEEQGLSSPLALLLCPSVFAKAVRGRSGELGKRIVAQVARKLTQG